jgi:hypothetical protein
MFRQDLLRSGLLRQIRIISQDISEGGDDPGLEDKYRVRMMRRSGNGYLYFCNVWTDRLPSSHKDVGKPGEVNSHTIHHT